MVATFILLKLSRGPMDTVIRVLFFCVRNAVYVLGPLLKCSTVVSILSPPLVELIYFFNPLSRPYLKKSESNEKLKVTFRHISLLKLQVEQGKKYLKLVESGYFFNWILAAHRGEKMQLIRLEATFII
jgi:flagellar biosynthesis protein FlhB